LSPWQGKEAVDSLSFQNFFKRSFDYLALKLHCLKNRGFLKAGKCSTGYSADYLLLFDAPIPNLYGYDILRKKNLGDC